MKIDLSCPAEVWRCQLIHMDLEGGQTGTGAEVVLHNLGDKTVVSTEVTLVLHARGGDETSRVLYRAHDLFARCREPFSFVVPLPEDEEKGEPYKVEVIIEKLWYEDGTVWRKSRNAMTEYQSNALKNGRDLEMLRFVAGDQAVGFPQEQEKVWLCVCGRPNSLQSTQCVHCLRTKDEVFRTFNRESVIQVVEAHQKKVDDKARATREEASRLQAEREKVAAQKKRKRNIRLVCILTVVILALLGYLGYFHLLPYLTYRDGVTKLQEGSYSEAIEVFSSMPNYRDAGELLLRSQYEQAKELLNTER